jgi:hypothetical protein
MRSARGGSHSFDCIPASIGLGSREAPSSVDHPTDYYFSLAEDALETSQDVIETLLIKLRLTVSSLIKKYYTPLQQMLGKQRAGGSRF